MQLLLIDYAVKIDIDDVLRSCCCFLSRLVLSRVHGIACVVE